MRLARCDPATLTLTLHPSCHSATFRLTLALARRWRYIRCIRCCSAI